MEVMKESDFLSQILLFLQDAEKLLGNNIPYIENIKDCQAVFTFSLPLRRDNGKIEVLKAFRVHHSYHKTPCKGGVRFAPNLNERDIRALSTVMSFKLSVYDIPLGGSWGGICIDPRLYSKSELERISKRYVFELGRKGFIAPSLDILSPDMGTTSETMAIMKEAYQTSFGYNDINSSAICTGKPKSLGGIEGRLEATGYGIYLGMKSLFEAEYFTHKYNLTPGIKGKTIIIQGLGVVGYYTGKFCYDNGMKIVGIIEYNSALYDDNGLNFDEAYAFFKANKTLFGFQAKEAAESEAKGEEFLYKPCDILIPCVKQMVININNCDKLQCKVVVEGAHCPTTYYAHRLLHFRGIAVVPDILLNGGGDVASYFEWLKDIRHVTLGRLFKGWEKTNKIEILKAFNKPISENIVKGPNEKDIVNTALEEMIASAIKATIEFATKNQCNLRTACYAMAIQKISKIYETSGLINF